MLNQLNTWFRKATFKGRRLSLARKVTAYLIYAAVYVPVVAAYVVFFNMIGFPTTSAGILGGFVGMILLLAHGVVNGNRVIT